MAESPTVYDPNVFDVTLFSGTVPVIPPEPAEVVTPIVFDPNVFDTAIFEASEVVPVIVKIAVPKEMQTVTFDSTVMIFAHIYLYGISSATALPMNLLTPPEIQVYDPYDAADLDFQPMTRVEDGVYRYQYIVPRSGWLGAYAARVRASNGAMQTVSKKAVVFTIHE